MARDKGASHKATAAPQWSRRKGLPTGINGALGSPCFSGPSNGALHDMGPRRGLGNNKEAFIIILCIFAMVALSGRISRVAAAVEREAPGGCVDWIRR